MKALKWVVILAVGAVGITVAAAVTGRIEALAAAVGLGGGAAAAAIAKARQRAEEAEEDSRDQLDAMSDAEVVEAGRRRDDALGRDLDDVRQRHEW